MAQGFIKTGPWAAVLPGPELSIASCPLPIEKLEGASNGLRGSVKRIGGGPNGVASVAIAPLGRLVVNASHVRDLNAGDLCRGGVGGAATTLLAGGDAAGVR
ncbi:MAG: hypothetical protein RI963_1415 [Planctomycetota bacterium]|jgi:hypothetical protein